MTDAPEGPGAPAERGSGRRSSRVGDSGSPVGSTLSIVLAVVAVIAGFLILRAITDDDDGDDTSDITLDTATDVSSPQGSEVAGTTPTPAGSDATTTTVNKAAATVVVANSSGIGGSAGAMSEALTSAGYTVGEPGNNSAGEQLAASVVYYTVGDVTAQGVAAAVATDMGGITVAEMPAPPPIDTGLGTATVLVMLGTDTANKTLADLNPATVTPPTVAGVTTTTAAG